MWSPCNGSTESSVIYNADGVSGYQYAALSSVATWWTTISSFSQLIIITNTITACVSTSTSSLGWDLCTGSCTGNLHKVLRSETLSLHAADRLINYTIIDKLIGHLANPKKCLTTCYQLFLLYPLWPSEGLSASFSDRQEGGSCGGPFQSFTSFPFLTTIPIQLSPIDHAIGESCQPHDEAMLTRSYTSSIMTTVDLHGTGSMQSQTLYPKEWTPTFVL